MIILPQVNENNKCILQSNGFSASDWVRTLYILNCFNNQYANFDNFVYLYAPFFELIAKEYYSNTEVNVLHTNEIAIFDEFRLADCYQIFNEACKYFKAKNKVAMLELEDYNYLNGDNLIRDHHRYNLYSGLQKIMVQSTKFSGLQEVVNQNYTIVLMSPYPNNKITQNKFFDVANRPANVYDPFLGISYKQFLEFMNIEDKQKIQQVHAQLLPNLNHIGPFNEIDIEYYLNPNNFDD